MQIKQNVFTILLAQSNQSDAFDLFSIVFIDLTFYVVSARKEIKIKL